LFGDQLAYRRVVAGSLDAANSTVAIAPDRGRGIVAACRCEDFGGPMKKPPQLVYGSEEQPPLAITMISALQHVGVVGIFLIYPLIVARAADVPAQDVAAILRLSMLVLAAGTVLQALPRGPVGSRFLAPSVYTGVYLAPSLLAAKLGGLPLVWGMTMFAGVVEIGLSRVWSRLRAFIPPETAGMVVFLIGVIIGLAALKVMLGEAHDGEVTGDDALIAGASLTTMIALNIWNKGTLRLFCILIGMAVGYVVAGFTGHITAAAMHEVLSQPLLASPTIDHISWAFDSSMVIPFAVTGLAAAMTATAVVTTYQRLNDAEWVRPEMRSISGGILGDGIAAIVAGLLGTHGVTISSANVGIVAATGVASRNIAFAMAGILVVMSFVPPVVGVLTIMPAPVMAAAMLFTAFFVMIGGIQIISTRVLDQRRTIVIGAGLTSFLAISVFPKAFAGVPHWAQSLTTSPLVLATIVALLLNLVFRIGIRRTMNRTIQPDALVPEDVERFIEQAGGAWGARRDVITRVEWAVEQALDALVQHGHIVGPIELSISYDEFDIDVRMAYQGVRLELPDRPPTHDELLEGDDGLRRMAGFLVRGQADRVQSVSDQGRSVLHLNFKH
jgi:NCS2 family nucleobase:cation symporter-2